MTSIKRSFFWSGVEQVGPRLVTFIIGVILARLLDPGDFGLLGMLALFMALATVFSDSGLSAALIQRQTLTSDDQMSVFVLNIVAGGVLAGLLCLISPFVARFYHQPILVPLLCANALTIVIASFAIVQSALLVRNMEFRKSATIATMSTIVSGITGVVMAANGCGVWSLIGSGISLAIVRTVMYWILSSWRPRGRIRWACICSMWEYSSYLLCCSLIGVIYQNMYNIIIGKVYSSESLGYYERANRLRMLPAGILAGIVNRVSFPLFSRDQDSIFMLLKRLREVIRVVTFLSAGGLILLAVIADPLIPLLLTEKWRPTVPLLRILCYASTLHPVHVVYLMTLQALGYSRLNLKLESIKMFIGIVAIALIYRHGVHAMAWSVVVLMLVAYVINAWYNVKLVGYKWQMQAVDILPSFVLCGISGWSTWWMGRVLFTASYASLLVQVPAYVMILFCGVWVFKESYFADVWKHLTFGVTWLCRRPEVDAP